MEMEGNQSATPCASPKLAVTYASPVIQLLVGAEKVQFHLQQSIAAKVSHFDKCLSGPFTESSSKTIELPDDDPAITDLLIHWLYTGNIPAITWNKDNTHREADELMCCTTLVKLYICADKFGIDGLMNSIVDTFISYHKDRFSVPSLITMLTQAGLQHCPLRQFFIFELASKITMFASGCDQYTSRDPEWEAAIRAFDPDDTLDVIRSIGAHVQPIRPQSSDKCQWHVHITTPKCKTASAQKK